VRKGGTHSGASSGCPGTTSIGVQTVVQHHFGELVNHYPIHGGKAFHLLVSFGRCKFKLSKFSVGLILQATIGGDAVDFRPQQISDRVFRFVVAPRNVRFHVYNLHSFNCDQFVLYFNLWSDGGALNMRNSA
jgi:hypothetical protein